MASKFRIRLAVIAVTMSFLLSGCLQNIKIRDDDAPASSIGMTKKLDDRWMFRAERFSVSGETDKAADLGSQESYIKLDNIHIEGPQRVAATMETYSLHFTGGYTVLKGNRFQMIVHGGMAFVGADLELIEQNGRRHHYRDMSVGPMGGLEISHAITGYLRVGSQVLGSLLLTGDAESEVRQRFYLTVSPVNTIDITAGWHIGGYTNNLVDSIFGGVGRDREGEDSDLELGTRGVYSSLHFRF